MIIEDRTNTKERKILAEMIGNRVVLGRIASQWNGNLFAAPWSNTLAKIAIDHYRKHHEAPGRLGIASLFEQWGEGKEETDDYQIINSYLGTIDIPNGELNHELALDNAGKHINKVKAKRLLDEGQADIEAGRVEKFLERVANFNRIELGVGAGVDFLHDDSVVDGVFASSEENLIKYPGDAGRFFQGMLARDSFVAFEAPEKTGKTFWLMDVAWRAMLQRRKVAFFEVGDMSQSQILRRFYCRAALHPFRSSNGWPLSVKYPKSITRTQEGAEIDHETRVFDKPLDAKKSKEALKRVLERKIKSKTSPIKLACYPNSTIDIPGIRSVLDSWALSGWNADVVVIDYADILAPPPGKLEVRDQINTAWKQMRALSQDLHCLVVTATQADADSYGRKTLDRKNFSEDKRKHSHVTGLVGINVYDDEKEKGIMRLNWIVLREGEYLTSRCLYCATCLPLANPCVRSCF